MATKINMKHPQTGLIKTGFYGYSWTTLCWGGFPALFRGDVITGLVVIVLNIFTWGVAGLIWGFFYNKNFTAKLIEKGYVFDGTDSEIALAKAAIGVM